MDDLQCQQPDQWRPIVPSYDAAGDITLDTNPNGTHQYLYDAEGRICAVQGTAVDGIPVMTGYVHDAEGRRVAKGTITTWSCDPSSNGFSAAVNETDYILDQSGHQITEMASDPSGNMAWMHTNVWADGQLIGTYDADGLHFYQNDWLGTRRAQTDYAGVQQQTCISLPFGDGLNCSGAGQYAPSLQYPTEHHFTGKERDPESGNDYFGARYYASTMGRWLSPDPSGQYFANPEDPQTWNLYAYVANNPLVNVDPFGLWIWSRGNCYYETVAVYVETNGAKDFQGYDTQPLGCFTPFSALPQQGQQSQRSQQAQQPQQPRRPHQPQPPKIDCSKPPSMPPTPSDADINANEQATKNHNMAWWLMEVRPGGAWDYKQEGKTYTSFGNVNYGATCNAGLGKDLTFCQKGAGAAAYATAATNAAQGKGWTAGPGNPLGSPADNNGMPDYGDQATGEENQSVIAGFGYAQWQKACGKL